MKFPTNKKNTTFLEGLKVQTMITDREWFVYTKQDCGATDYMFFETCDQAMNYYRKVSVLYGYMELIHGSAFRSPSGKTLVQINKRCTNAIYNMDVITLS